MAKVKVRVTKGFPFYHHEDRIYITAEPVEVTENDWLKAQIDAGLVEVVEVAKAVKQKSGKEVNPETSTKAK